MEEKYLRRFWSKVDKTPGCWNWTASTQSGYGAYGYRVDGTTKTPYIHMTAHRFSYMINKGPIGDLCVRHTCDNKLCVNPSHLILGTHKDNMRDMAIRNRSARGEKNSGHKLTEAQVREIKNIVQLGQRGGRSVSNVRELAEKYAVSCVSIRNIALGKRWSHI